jgi:hypothetical protein
MATKKDIKYINRDFDSFKSALTEFSKTYFPDTYTDFSPTSPGTMFMEMAAYVGDVLSFYLDNQTQENFIQFARQNENLYSLAYALGYRPKITEAAVAELEIFQQVPSKLDPITSTYVPDYNYVLNIKENLQVASNTANSTDFLVEDSIDFSFSSSAEPTDVSIYQIDSNNNPQYYLLKKKRKAVSATINSVTHTFGPAEKFATIQIEGANIIKILDVTDSDGNTWYEVPYLAQDMVYKSIPNNKSTDFNFEGDNGEVPYLLRLEKTQRRFVSRFKDQTTLELQFGAGTAIDDDEDITPNPNNVGIGLPFAQDKLTTAYSPANFTLTDSYGVAPSNTTLTIRYLTGGGVSSNVPSNTLTKVTDGGKIKFANFNLDEVTANYVFNSVLVNNPNAATGGKDGDTIEELRFNSLNTFQTQLRTVTQDDYLIRALSLPSEYGSLAKVYAEPEKPNDILPGEIPSVLSLFVLAYDNNKKLTSATRALKQNLITYLSQHKMINDSIRIKDGRIVNIGVDFELLVLPNYNSNEVISQCIIQLQNYFNIDKWQINQPIILRELYILLDKVEGVQTVKNINITNKVGENLGYSKFAYDIKGATKNNIIYPSLNPCIFEVKFPSDDIRGKVTSF